ncbi:MAG: hypothetical protein HY002_17345 [Candidatus Rokubacteria bacterium]|nr:hypothetical protein [Candidatus Rokubacteria bacterium]
MEEDPAEAVHRIEITGIPDRHAAEALQLEIRRLARRYGIDIREIRIEEVANDFSA